MTIPEENSLLLDFKYNLYFYRSLLLRSAFVCSVMTNSQMLPNAVNSVSFDKGLVHVDCLFSQCTLSVMCIYLKHSSDLDTQP